MLMDRHVLALGGIPSKKYNFGILTAGRLFFLVFLEYLILMSAIYKDLCGKVVLITGGANGIGAAMVESFCHQGAKVYFCDSDETTGRQLAATLKEKVIFQKLNLVR